MQGQTTDAAPAKGLTQNVSRWCACSWSGCRRSWSPQLAASREW